LRARAVLRSRDELVRARPGAHTRARDPGRSRDVDVDVSARVDLDLVGEPLHMSSSDSARASAVIQLRPPPVVAASSRRLPGFDVARAVAVLGMVIVDVRHEFLVYDGSSALLWLFDALEGKAAALFVLLAGVGLTLRTRTHDDVLATDRRPLVERAFLLIGLGVILAHLWKYDVLHFHGVYLLLAIPLVRARAATLWALAVAAIWVALVLHRELDWTVQTGTGSFVGVLRHLFFNGLYPVFPWIAFVFVGMAVGRLDLAGARTRRRTLAIALVILGLTSVLDAIGRHEQRTGALDLGGWTSWLLSWPRAPRPLFVASGCAFAIAVVCASISLMEGRGERGWSTALVATGQLAFSIYVAHVVAILVPLTHGLLQGLRIELALAYSLVVYVVAITFATWWRRRWELGPLEGLLRQVTERDRVGPPPNAPLVARASASAQRRGSPE
jgi:uncharacterized protein